MVIGQGDVPPHRGIHKFGATTNQTIFFLLLLIYSDYNIAMESTGEQIIVTMTGNNLKSRFITI